MPRIAVGTENDTPIEIYYEDHGSGQPVVLIHGYPLNSDSWERQEPVLLDAGHRVIRYDRRGFGNSSRPTTGFDHEVFEGIKATIVKDRYAYFKDFFDNFWNTDKLTDFRSDLPKIDVPMLVMHGTEDRILPFESTAKRLPDLVSNLKLIPVEGGPHNIGWTHPDEVNKGLLDFLAEDAGPRAGLTSDLTAATRRGALNRETRGGGIVPATRSSLKPSSLRRWRRRNSASQRAQGAGSGGALNSSSSSSAT